MAKTAPVMNFFEHQDRARRKTGRLILLFVVTYVLMTAAVYVVVYAGLVWKFPPSPFQQRLMHDYGLPVWIAPEMLGIVAGSMLAVVAIASLVRVGTLRQGGSAVAKILGGTPVPPETRDPHKRRLLNIVEEMAIASGVPMPQVFVLESENGINAFAAGYEPADAAVTVTRGALVNLNREELQGVIAHEFSHILNGDMRLNIRLMGVLFGILAIALLGRLVTRFSFDASRISTRVDDARGKLAGAGASLFVFVLGLTLIVVGYIGVLMGRIIKAAVSRQREFLADASAVQFTRNPDGLAGALRKIMHAPSGSLIGNVEAEEVSHMFFGQGVKSFLPSIFSTHPPLAERIARIEGRPYDAKAAAEDARLHAGSAVRDDALGFAAQAHDEPGAAVSRAIHEAVAPMRVDAASVKTRVGNLGLADLGIGAAIRATIPREVHDSSSYPAGSKILLAALLLDADESQRENQLRLLAMQGESVARTADAVFNAMAKMDPRARISVAELALRALNKLPYEEKQALVDRLRALIDMDGRVTFSEFCLHWLARHRLLRLDEPPPVHDRRLKPLRDDVRAVLLALAFAGTDSADAARDAYANGAARLPELDLAPEDAIEQPDFGRLETAMERVGCATFAVRGQVIDAAAHVIFADRVVTIAESDMIRALAIAWDCPLPPFVAE
ncbi:MAG: M48 family metallopeptidase [Deltaproteobacteria bacterium]|nr:M48 family metallopeptidase [Deltaproteobacteria bacterium]